MKHYRYTKLNLNGTAEVIETTEKKWDLDKLQAAVGGHVQIVPEAYYAHQGWGRCTVYADDDGRGKKLSDNLHFTMFPNGRFMMPVVGECLRVDRVEVAE